MMRALLIQHGCEAALEVLREVIGDTTAAGVLSKLETLYMIKSLANKLYLEKKLYTFYMLAGRKIFEHIYEFNKIVLDLANIEIKFEDEDLALLLLTSLPTSYEHFVDILLYRREALTLEDVMATLNSKEIKERSKAKRDDGEGLYVRGRTNHSVISSSSTVTYTSVYTDSELGRVFCGADEELSNGGSLRVIISGYDRLPMQPVAPPSPDYVPGCYPTSLIHYTTIIFTKMLENKKKS
ncbi:hypothetical protein Tco_0052985 [Tanacetum coccineum]